MYYFMGYPNTSQSACIRSRTQQPGSSPWSQKREPFKAYLGALHWLPIDQRIENKVPFQHLQGTYWTGFIIYIRSCVPVLTLTVYALLINDSSDDQETNQSCTKPGLSSMLPQCSGAIHLSMLEKTPLDCLILRRKLNDLKFA